MLAALSPYHLTTREPSAMAALLLAQHAVTLIPTPFAGAARPALDRAAAAVPRYVEFMESWRWSVPLWNDGVIASAYAGEDAAGDVRAVCEHIDTEEALAELRPLMRRALFEDEGAYLDAVAADLLKAGPDPGISVPVAAGLDRFARRHDLVTFRSHAVSLAQQAESRMADRRFAVAVPVLLQASGERVLEARHALADPLEALRAAIDYTIADGPGMDGEAAVRAAAGAFADAFVRERTHLLRPEDDEDELRVLEGMVAVTGVVIPVDAVLRASLVAVRRLAGRARPAPALPPTGETVRALVVKPLGRQARPGWSELSRCSR